MARRGFTAPLPRAFMSSSENAVTFAISRLAKEQRHMATRHITVEDLRQLFIPSHDRHALKEAFRITEFNVTKQVLPVEIPLLTDYPIAYQLNDANKPFRMSFMWDFNMCPTGFFVPRKVRAFVQPDAPPELLEKLDYVQREQARISLELGMVRHVFQNLNQNGFCNTPAQMRYVWPAIRHIADKAGLKDIAPTLVEASARAGDKARVPPAIAPLLIPTTDIINRTVLLPKIDLNETREFGHTCDTTTYDMTVDGHAVSVSGMS